jgi:hypothetical protein
MECYYNYRIEENGSGGAYMSRMGKIINAYKTLARKANWKNQYMKIRHRSDNLVILQWMSKELDVECLNLI